MSMDAGDLRIQYILLSGSCWYRAFQTIMIIVMATVFFGGGGGVSNYAMCIYSRASPLMKTSFV